MEKCDRAGNIINIYLLLYKIYFKKYYLFNQDGEGQDGQDEQGGQDGQDGQDNPQHSGYASTDEDLRDFYQQLENDTGFYGDD